MESAEISQILEMSELPSLYVEDGIIRCANHSALARMVPLNEPILPLLETGSHEYAAFSDGCLCLSLRIRDTVYNATVKMLCGHHLFQLEPGHGGSELQSLALAAQELRSPLERILANTETLFPKLNPGVHSEEWTQMAQINRSLYQLHRLIGNMSDAGTAFAPVMELQDVTAVFQEIFDGAASLCAASGITLEFSNLPASTYSLVNRDGLERAVYNLLSNAMKYTSPGGTIRSSLTHRKNTLYFTMTDSGSGMSPGVSANAFTRYLREPGIEDSRFGLGLGLMLVHTTATAHGGTVLLDHPAEGGVRIVLSMPIRQKGDTVRSPVLHIDYAGERDHGLVELSDVLPYELYGPK